MTTFDAWRLIGDLEVSFDVDVLVGAYPDRDSPPDPFGLLAEHRVRRAAVASLRAALFDLRSGNDEVVAGPSVLPVCTVDLRDPIGSVREMERLAGAKAVRLFPDEQGVEAGFPSVRHVAKKAIELGMVILAGGDVRRFWQPLSGATVVFLDTHFYHLGDFLVIAKDEPGFHTSTRLLNSPDALETVASEVGAERLLYGSRTPYYEPIVPLLRLATSALKPDEIAAVAGGNARRLLG